MIRSFSVTNFGPINEKQTLGFEASNRFEDDYLVYTMPDGTRLLKFSVLFGPNASGKSSFLNALSTLAILLTQSPKSKTDKINYNSFAFKPNIGYSEFGLDFYVVGVRMVFNLIISERGVENESLFYYPEGRRAHVFTRISDFTTQTSTVSFGKSLKVNSSDVKALTGNLLLNSTVLAAYGRTNINIEQLNQFDQWLDQVLMPPVYTNSELKNWAFEKIHNHNEVSDFVGNFLFKADPQITGFTIQKEEIERGSKLVELYNSLLPINEQIDYSGKIVHYDVNFQHKVMEDSVIINFEYQSDGTKLMFYLAAVFYQLIHNNSILFFDEMEKSLHPDLFKLLIQSFLLNSKGSQLLITSHNIHLLSDDSLLRADNTWFTEKSDKGATELYRVSDLPSSVIRKGSNMLLAYESGKLGAKPNLGSPL